MRTVLFAAALAAVSAVVSATYLPAYSPSPVVGSGGVQVLEGRMLQPGSADEWRDDLTGEDGLPEFVELCAGIMCPMWVRDCSRPGKGDDDVETGEMMKRRRRIKREAVCCPVCASSTPQPSSSPSMTPEPSSSPSMTPQPSVTPSPSTSVFPAADWSAGGSGGIYWWYQVSLASVSATTDREQLAQILANIPLALEGGIIVPGVKMLTLAEARKVANSETFPVVIGEMLEPLFYALHTLLTRMGTGATIGAASIPERDREVRIKRAWRALDRFAVFNALPNTMYHNGTVVVESVGSDPDGVAQALTRMVQKGSPGYGNTWTLAEARELLARVSATGPGVVVISEAIGAYALVAAAVLQAYGARAWYIESPVPVVPGPSPNNIPIGVTSA